MSDDNDLKDDLMAISGIGEVTADDIMDVLADHDLGGESVYLQKAREAAREGNDRDAAMYLRRDGGE